LVGDITVSEKRGYETERITGVNISTTSAVVPAYLFTQTAGTLGSIFTINLPGGVLVFTVQAINMKEILQMVSITD
jgi:hypothetical protein